MLYGVWCDKHLICRWWCGPYKCSRAYSDQNATGQVLYGLTEVADVQVVRYRVVKLQGLCLVQNLFFFGTKFVFASTTAWLWSVCRQERYVSTSVMPSSESCTTSLLNFISVPFMFLAGAGRVVRWWRRWYVWKQDSKQEVVAKFRQQPKRKTFATVAAVCFTNGMPFKPTNNKAGRKNIILSQYGVEKWTHDKDIR